MFTLNKFPSFHSTDLICLREITAKVGNSKKPSGMPEGLPDAVLVSVARDLRNLINQRNTTPSNQVTIFAPQTLIYWAIEEILPEGVARRGLSQEEMDEALTWYGWLIEGEIVNRITGVYLEGEAKRLQGNLLKLYMRK